MAVVLVEMICGFTAFNFTLASLSCDSHGYSSTPQFTILMWEFCWGFFSLRCRGEDLIGLNCLLGINYI